MGRRDTVRTGHSTLQACSVVAEEGRRPRRRVPTAENKACVHWLLSILWPLLINCMHICLLHQHSGNKFIPKSRTYKETDAFTDA